MSIPARALTTDTYVTTPAFRSIPAHACVTFADDGGLVATTGHAGDPASEAYARLFAAAPALLEVARIAAAWPRTPGECEIVDRARAAIGRATGEAPPC